MATNDVTGDTLVSKPNTTEYMEGYDRIFKKPIPEKEEPIDSTESTKPVEDKTVRDE